MGTYSPVPIAPVPVDCWFAGNLVSGIFAAIRVQFKLIAYQLIQTDLKEVSDFDNKLNSRRRAAGFNVTDITMGSIAQIARKCAYTHTAPCSQCP